MVESNTESYYRNLMADDDADPDTVRTRQDGPVPAGEPDPDMVDDVLRCAAGPLARPGSWSDEDERRFRDLAGERVRDALDEMTGVAEMHSRCEQLQESLAATVNDAFRDLTGKDLPPALGSNLRQLLAQILQTPFNEPEHGLKQWTNLPQHSLPMMVVARPLDLLGSPTRTEVDLMMLHTIRMGRFLTTHYVQWAQTLPACWIRHDDVVHEVYSLKCYMDMIVAAPNGGLYAPTMQALIQSALVRVKSYLEASSASDADHTHHMADPDLRTREQARHAEYEAWFDRSDAWADEPAFDRDWRFASAREGVDAACDLVTPTRIEAAGTDDDVAMGTRVDEWRARIDGLRGNYDVHRDDGERFLDQARDAEETIRRAWLDYTTREGEVRDRLDRAVASASLTLRRRDAVPAMTDGERAELEDLVGRGRAILREHGKNMRDVDYRPCSIDMQERIASRIERLVDGDPAAVFDRCDRMLDRFDHTIGREGADS